MRIVYLDTETSGLRPGQVTQLAYVMAEGGKLVYRFNQYYTVDFIETDAARITGLNVDILKTLSDGTKFSDTSDIVLADLNNKLVVGHNIAFDEKFVSAEFARLGKSFFFTKTFDTMHRLTNVIKLPSRRKNAAYKSPKLAEAMAYMGITPTQVTQLTTAVFGQDDRCAHDARFDCIATYMVCEVAKQRGIFDLSLMNM